MIKQNVYAHLSAALDEHDHVVLVTLEADGRLRSSRIGSPFMDENGTLWFLTDINAPHVHHVEQNPEVCIYCGNIGNFESLSISGVGFVVTNVSMQQKKSSMQSIHQALTNGSKEMVLIKVSIDYFEYWDNNSNKQIRHTKCKQAVMLNGVSHHAKQRGYA